MVTVVTPLLVVDDGALALTQLAELLVPSDLNVTLGSTTSPPGTSPFGTVLGAESATLRAAFCTACIAWIACAARVRAFIDCCAICAASCADVIADVAALRVALPPLAPQPDP